jgi:hypothetical protein
MQLNAPSIRHSAKRKNARQNEPAGRTARKSPKTAKAEHGGRIVDWCAGALGVRAVRVEGGKCTHGAVVVLVTYLTRMQPA